jgi:hypothetical protein
MIRPRTKRISLEFLGEGWEDAYLESRLMRHEDLDTINGLEKKEGDKDEMYRVNREIIKLFFVAGKGPDTDGSLVEMTTEDIDAFDIFTARQLALAVGVPDPKDSPSWSATSAAADPNQPTSETSDTANVSA